MLLIEVEECEKCEFFVMTEKLRRCKQENINNLKPGGEFDYYHGDIANCICSCTYFLKFKN